MDEDEVHLAVLFALQTASRTHEHVTCSTLFSVLPQDLRRRWSESYLAKHVLRDLYYHFLIEITMVATQVVYSITPQGRRFMAEG